MRTTVTLDEDVAAQLETARQDERLGFKEALNRALRRGLATKRPRPRRRYRLKTFDTGAPLVPLDDVTQALAFSSTASRSSPPTATSRASPRSAR